MKSILQQADADDMLKRLARLQPGTKALWGKMDASQMMAHCQVPIQSALGDRQLKPTLFGRLFGGIAKKRMVNEKPFTKNLPTDPRFVIKETDRDFNIEKQKLQSLIQRFSDADKNAMAARKHPFFGKLTVDEWGLLTWKHLDHHFRQFGV